MQNPYEILAEKEILQHYSKKLGIADCRIFQSSLQNDVDNSVYSSIFTVFSGVPNYGKLVSWLAFNEIKLDSQAFFLEQLRRLEARPDTIETELAINLLCFAGMSKRIYGYLKSKDSYAVSVRFVAALFSSRQRDKLALSILLKIREPVRWCYMSFILLLIYYMMICEKLQYSYDILRLKKIAMYVANTLYKECDNILACFEISSKEILQAIGDYNSLHDVLIDSYALKNILATITEGKKDALMNVLSKYYSDDSVKLLFADLEEYIQAIEYNKEDMDS